MADQATQRMVIGASPQRCFDTIVDFDHYTTWARDLKEAEVVARDDDGRSRQVAFRAAAMGRSTNYTLEYDYSDAPRKVAWRLVRGDIMRELDGNYEFRPVDENRYPCLRLARQAMSEGGGAPAVYNAANEVAVAAFLAAQTPFQHVTVALFIFLYCAIRTVGLSVIERSELVMQGVPHTPATEGFMHRARFQRMKRSAYFINIGRGKTTRLDDLVAALRAGEIAGAGLDVFEQEPLPADHPLWTMPGVLMTPHTAGFGPYLDERRFDMAVAATAFHWVDARHGVTKVADHLVDNGWLPPADRSGRRVDLDLDGVLALDDAGAHLARAGVRRAERHGRGEGEDERLRGPGRNGDRGIRSRHDLVGRRIDRLIGEDSRHARGRADGATERGRRAAVHDRGEHRDGQQHLGRSHG